MTCPPKTEPLVRRVCSINVLKEGTDDEETIYRGTNHPRVKAT